MIDFIGLAAAEEEYMIRIRRHMHENPELSGKEDGTIKMISDELTKLGITFDVVDDGGILAYIDGPTAGKTVVLRADVDALPMQEAPDNLVGPKVAVSKVDGVCHSCGHDGHTAMLLGAAKILLANREAIKGRVILMFERGEESTGNIIKILKHISDKNIQIDSSYGIHLFAMLEAGKISMNNGPVMAGVFAFNVTIQGKGGHGSRPDQSNSPIDCFLAFGNAIQSLRMKYADPFNALTYSIGYLKSGAVSNIIPETLEFGGTVRLYNMQDGVNFKKEFTNMLEHICAAYNCTFTGKLLGPTIPVINDDACAELARSAVGEAIGSDRVVWCEPWMASESMSTILALYPGVFAFLGIENPEQGIGAAHHNQHFDLDESVFKLGAASAAAYAIGFLNSDIDTSAKKWQGTLGELYKYSNRDQKSIDYLDGKIADLVL